ncbi:hypothetical protein VNO78_03028 [Psophocarpus tetragonolobus]|uniref:Factor of DNA methylation 1 n=1 Tax=Psophocarpus tetragonolobus TaxID=3891 RepID=A0AAN9T0U0_PSOTE
MGSSSEEESEISESEKEEYKEKTYDQLTAGKYKVKNSNGTLRCPFCEGKKKQAFGFKDLLQHASGVGTGSSKRREKIKAKHLALAQYLKEDLSNELDNNDNSQANSQEMEIVIENPNTDERFVWPWTVIVANIFGMQKHEPEKCDSKHWLKKFELYKPKEAHVLHGTDEDPGGHVVLEFGTEWTGFRLMMKLDTVFLADKHGKNDYESRKVGHVSGLYGWCARAEDYNSEGLVGTYLRENAELKTTSKVHQEAWKEKTKTLDHLVGEMGYANEMYHQMEEKINVDNMSLNKMMKETNWLQQTRAADIKLMQESARKRVFKVMQETEKLQHDINTRNAELDRWCQKLIEQETSTIQERRKFEEEKKRKVESLMLASEEQMKARCDFASLLEKHQMEKKTQTDALLKLEKEMENEHKLRLEIAELEGQIKVLKCMNVEGADHEKSKKEIKEMEEKLEDLIFDGSVKDDENQALQKKEQQAKAELEEARQELIKELPRFLQRVTNIGIKKIGEINAKTFRKVCKTRYKESKRALQESNKLLAKWQKEVLDSAWHPFKILEVEGKEKQEVIDEDDSKLSSLKEDLGNELYEAVVTALKELHEYHNSNHAEVNPNSSEKSVIPVIWNFKTGRRATLTEALNYIISKVTKKKIK